MFEQQALCSAAEYAVEGELVSPEIYRADGACLCSACGQEYRKHPWDEQELSGMDFDHEGNGLPYLRVLCNGDRVKL